MVAATARETLTYYRFPRPHWRGIRAGGPMERTLQEVRRQVLVIGAFPDGHGALMLRAARPRHVAGRSWGTRRYVDTCILRTETEASEDANYGSQEEAP